MANQYGQKHEQLEHSLRIQYCIATVRTNNMFIHTINSTIKASNGQIGMHNTDYDHAYQ